MNRIRLRVVVSAALAALLYGQSPALAQTAPPLGAAQSFAVLAGSTITNTGPSVVTGDLGLHPGIAITGFPPGTVTGTIHNADATALAAKTALTLAYNNLSGQACGTDLSGQDLGGLTLTSGVYCYSAAAQLTGNLTLNPAGNPNAVFIIKIATALTTAAASSVTITAPGSACNVFWQVGSSATLGAATTFRGNILALTSITGVTGSSVQGRTMARNGAVTLDTNAVDASLCAAPPPASLPPTLDKIFSPDSITQGGVSTLTITLTNPNATTATLNAAFTDTLPSGLLIAATPNASTTCTGAGAVSATAGGSTVTLPSTRSIPVGSCTVTVNVSAALPGTYVNTLAAGTLQTNHGNNAAPAADTLIVIPTAPGPPTILKAFTPTIITQGEVSTLRITVSNPNATAASLNAAFTDTLPSGLVIAATPNASTTCTGTGAVGATAGGNTVTLPATRFIPAVSCTVTVSVTAATAGSYVNTIPINALQTSNGNNAAPASATLTAIPPVPTLPEWALIALVALLGLTGVLAMRRRAI
jgi:uncharacterized repeat protein (TIGR01451 family)